MGKAFSFGGGVQSTAALILSAKREIDFPIHIMADVGEDSEDPLTVAYVRDVAQPYAKAHGIELITVQRSSKKRGFESIFAKLMRTATSIDVLKASLPS